VHREDVTKVFALLETRPPSWYDYVLEHIKSVECKSGEPLSFTQTENVISNLMLGATVYPEVMISSDIYSDGHDEINIYFMAGALVHKSCHIRQMHEGWRWFTMTAYDSEKECMMADGGNLYKDIGAPRWIIIIWNQGIIDKRTTTSDDDDGFFCVGMVLAVPEGSGVFSLKPS